MEPCALCTHIPWWRHQMETFSALLAFCGGIHRSPVNSPHKGKWRGALMFSLICALNKRLSKQSWGWWFETPSCSLWRHCNVFDDKSWALGQSQNGRNILGCALFLCWMSPSSFFTNITINVLFHHTDYYFYWHVYAHGYTNWTTDLGLLQFWFCNRSPLGVFPLLGFLLWYWIEHVTIGFF